MRNAPGNKMDPFRDNISVFLYVLDNWGAENLTTQTGYWEDGQDFLLRETRGAGYVSRHKVGPGAGLAQGLMDKRKIIYRRTY